MISSVRPGLMKLPWWQWSLISGVPFGGLTTHVNHLFAKAGLRDWAHGPALRLPARPRRGVTEAAVSCHIDTEERMRSLSGLAQPRSFGGTMNSAPPVWSGHPATAPLRRRALVASVLVWLGALAPAPLAAGLLIVVVTRSMSDPLTDALWFASVIAIPLTWPAAAIGAAAWAWRARLDAAYVTADRHRFGADWAAMGWFVPVAGLVIPLVVVTDLVRAIRPAGVGTATVRRWWGAWITGSVVLPACAAASPATPCPDLVLVPAVVLVAVLLAVSAASFTRITLAVAAARDAALRPPTRPWNAPS
jgi:hypothetical protein